MAFAKWRSTITDLEGNVLPQALVTVRNEVTGALAVLYADRDGASGRGNPFLADGQGFAAFHVTGGAYRITARLGEYEQEWRYVGVGTAQEVDVEELGIYLQAGLITVQALTDLSAIVPETFPMGGVVLADPVGANNGYYTNQGSGWAYARPLPDTFARLYVTSGTVNAVQTTLDAAVNPSAPTVFFIDVLAPNTGPVTLTINGANVGPVLNAAGNALSAGEWQGRVLFTREADGSYRIVNDPASALVASLAATEATNQANRAEEEADRSRDEADRAEAAATQVENPVSYKPQTLTGAEQAQARTNIGAVNTTAAIMAQQVNGLSASGLPVDNDAFFMTRGTTPLKIYWQTIRNWLVSRANHTGTQAMSTIAGLADALSTLTNVTYGLEQNKVNIAGSPLTGGFTAAVVNDGTKSSGTYTPDPTTGNWRRINNGGASGIVAPTKAGCFNMIIDITNVAGAGAKTFTGFVTGHPKGDDLTTTNGHKFKLHIAKSDIGVTAIIEALQ